MAANTRVARATPVVPGLDCAVVMAGLDSPVVMAGLDPAILFGVPAPGPERCPTTGHPMRARSHPLCPPQQEDGRVKPGHDGGGPGHDGGGPGHDGGRPGLDGGRPGHDGGART